MTRHPQKCILLSLSPGLAAWGVVRIRVHTGAPTMSGGPRNTTPNPKRDGVPVSVSGNTWGVSPCVHAANRPAPAEYGSIGRSFMIALTLLDAAILPILIVLAAIFYIWIGFLVLPYAMIAVTVFWFYMRTGTSTPNSYIDLVFILCGVLGLVWAVARYDARKFRRYNPRKGIYE